MNPFLAIGLVFVLLALNALFVAAEFALISARRTQLEPKARSGSRPARLAIRAMERVSLAMAAAQLGITLCSLGLGAVGEPAIAHLFEPVFDAVGVPHGWVHPISFVIAMGIVTYLHVVLGEMVPKNVALAGPDRAVLWLGPFMLGVIMLLKPFVVALNAIANGAVRLVRLEPKDEVGATFTSDEVAGLLDESHREGLLDSGEYELVSGALEFEAGTVERVLLPRASLVTIPVGATRADIERVCAADRVLALPGDRLARVAGRLPPHQGRPRGVGGDPSDPGEVDPAAGLRTPQHAALRRPPAHAAARCAHGPCGR